MVSGRSKWFWVLCGLACLAAGAAGWILFGVPIIRGVPYVYDASLGLGSVDSYTARYQSELQEEEYDTSSHSTMSTVIEVQAQRNPQAAHIIETIDGSNPALSTRMLQPGTIETTILGSTYYRLDSASVGGIHGCEPSGLTYFDFEPNRLLESMSFEGFSQTLDSGLKLYPAGPDEIVNGFESQHYSTQARHLQQSCEGTLIGPCRTIYLLRDATIHLWVTPVERYVTRIILEAYLNEQVLKSYGGPLSVQYDLLAVNQPVSIELSGECRRKMLPRE